MEDIQVLHTTHLHTCHVSTRPPFLSITSHSPRSTAETVYQLRSGHIALNKPLHRLNKSVTLSCLQCEAGPPETVHRVKTLECRTNMLNNWVNQSRGQVNASSRLNGGRTGDTGNGNGVGRVVVLQIQDAMSK